MRRCRTEVENTPHCGHAAAPGRSCADAPSPAMVVDCLDAIDRHLGQPKQNRRTVPHARGSSHQLLQTQPVSRDREPSAHNTKIVSGLASQLRRPLQAGADEPQSSGQFVHASSRSAPNGAMPSGRATMQCLTLRFQTRVAVQVKPSLELPNPQEGVSWSGGAVPHSETSKFLLSTDRPPSAPIVPAEPVGSAERSWLLRWRGRNGELLISALLVTAFLLILLAITRSQPPTPSPPIMGGNLPAKIVAGYWQRWQGPNVAEITANAPEYNLEYAAVAQSAGAGTGAVSFFPDFAGAALFKTDMAASKNKGTRWLLTVGGGGDGGIKLLNEIEASQMVNSVIPIIDEYGFQGLDFDLESGQAGWNTSSMKSVALQLQAHYGAGFIISAAPRPYEDWYRDWAVAMGPALDLFGYQFYDFPETNDTAFLRSYIKMRVDEAVRLGIPASKLMIGCITYPNYSGGHNTVEVYRDIFKENEQMHPDLRGVYVWETSLDKLDNWHFAHVMGHSVRGLS
jgi:Glycosyl hydrolases family 18